MGEEKIDSRRFTAVSQHILSRRQFIKGLAAVSLGTLAAHCRMVPSPQVSKNDGQNSLPLTQDAALLPSPTTKSKGLATVAISKVRSYDRTLVRQNMENMLNSIGGISDVIRHGNRVAVKVNLTGGNYFSPPEGVTAIESYMTHPEVVRALCELLLDAGAAKIFIVEAIFDDASYGAFGYKDMASPLNADLIDLNQFAPFSGYTTLPVGSEAFIYGELTVNAILEEVDVFVSISKMKCHYEAGVTHSMKNLVGIVPAHAYRLQENHWWRSGLHGQGDEVKKRLPKVIVDLNRARPVQLAVIDGIMAAEGGEVPRGSFHPVAPGVLLAGKNPVSTDAVATAVMGFNPEAEAPDTPFLRGDNHLNIAASIGLGTNNLDEIDVVGATIESAAFPFRPSTSSG